MHGVTVLDTLLDSPLREAESRKLKCPKCGTVQSASNSKCTSCGHDLADARKAKFANLSEGFDDALHPRDWHGRWKRAPGGKVYETEHRGHSMRLVAQNTAAGGPRWKAYYKNPRGEERIVAKGDELKSVRADATTHFRAVTKRPTPIVPHDPRGPVKPEHVDPSRHPTPTAGLPADAQRFADAKRRSELARSYDEGRKAQSARAEILAKSPGAAAELRAYNDVKAAAQNPGRPTYHRNEDGEIAPERPPTMADHRRALAAISSPEYKARGEELRKANAYLNHAVTDETGRVQLKGGYAVMKPGFEHLHPRMKPGAEWKVDREGGGHWTIVSHSRTHVQVRSKRSARVVVHPIDGFVAASTPVSPK